MDDEKRREAVGEEFARALERFIIAVYSEGFESAKDLAIQLAKKEGQEELAEELMKIKPEDDK